MSFRPVVIDREATFAAVRPLLTAACWAAFTSQREKPLPLGMGRKAHAAAAALAVGDLPSML